MSDHKIKRALIAVYDKTGVADFARALVNEFGVEIISTGGTAKHLKDAGIPVTMVEQVTGFPELLDGRVKTLHPKIHAAILADRDNPEHMRQLAEHGIEPIDMVVVNLYPFEKTIADPNCTFEQAIEMIDIGGPCMLRAAAKNHRHVLVVAEPSAYEATLVALRDGETREAKSRSSDIHQCGALTAFLTTSKYDSRIAAWLSRGPFGNIPLFESLHLCTMESLRYGENPHQGATYRHLEGDPGMGTLLADDKGCSQSMSFNNYVDADAATALCSELARVPPYLWHRFSTGAVWTRFPTGSGVKEAVTSERITQRNLPHLQKPGSTYFITFRVQRGTLLPAERDIALQACRFWHAKKMTLHSVVIMPDHVHLLLTPHEIQPGSWVNLGELLHSIKRHSSYEINKLRGQAGSLWQDESFDRLVRDEKEFVEKWDYIEANPFTAQIVKPGQAYPWFWRSEAGFQETIQFQGDRLETCPTGHRLETGATETAIETITETGGTPSASEQAQACVFIKHTNACGVGVSPDPVKAYRQAYYGDPNAAMGGILACNFKIDAEFAATVMETYDRFGKPLKDAGHSAAPGGFFVEVWIAPAFDEDAIAVIRGTAEGTELVPQPPKKKWGANVRLLAVGDMSVAPSPDEMDYKRIAGGMLVQTRDLVGLNEDQWKVVTKRSPTESEMADLRLAWLISKHTKSNAITICKDGMLIGNGAGQMSRVMSCRIATWLAKENGHAEKLPGSAAASDAFFPFKDGPEILMDAGVTAIIQPGGSKRDEDTIAACDERGVAMIFTGTRHFKH